MAKIHVQYYYLGLREKSDPDDFFYLTDNYNFKEIEFPLLGCRSVYCRKW